jgi:hypothetical protein
MHWTISSSSSSSSLLHPTSRTRDETQGLTLARQVFYHLNHYPNPFILFWDSLPFPRLVWNFRSSCLCLPSSWDYRCAPWCQAYTIRCVSQAQAYVLQVKASTSQQSQPFGIFFSFLILLSVLSLHVSYSTHTVLFISSIKPLHLPIHRLIWKHLLNTCYVQYSRSWESRVKQNLVCALVKDFQGYMSWHTSVIPAPWKMKVRR